MRGRPPNPKFKSPMGIANYPSHQQIVQLGASIRKLPEVNSLTNSQQKNLISDIATAMGYYLSTEQLRKLTPAKSRGNRNHTHKQVLLWDCARAWAKASGTDPAIWQKDPDEVADKMESTSVTIARFVIHICTGRQVQVNLRDQSKKARKIRAL